jgi:hypothetical protein
VRRILKELISTDCARFTRFVTPCIALILSNGAYGEVPNSVVPFDRMSIIVHPPASRKLADGNGVGAEFPKRACTLM